MIEISDVEYKQKHSSAAIKMLERIGRLEFEDLKQTNFAQLTQNDAEFGQILGELLKAPQNIEIYEKSIPPRNLHSNSLPPASNSLPPSYPSDSKKSSKGGSKGSKKPPPIDESSSSLSKESLTISGEFQCGSNLSQASVVMSIDRVCSKQKSIHLASPETNNFYMHDTDKHLNVPHSNHPRYTVTEPSQGIERTATHETDAGRRCS
jgi:hypothetical protein